MFFLGWMTGEHLRCSVVGFKVTKKVKPKGAKERASETRSLQVARCKFQDGADTAKTAQDKWVDFINHKTVT